MKRVLRQAVLLLILVGYAVANAATLGTIEVPKARVNCLVPMYDQLQEKLDGMVQEAIGGAQRNIALNGVIGDARLRKALLRIIDQIAVCSREHTEVFGKDAADVQDLTVILPRQITAAVHSLFDTTAAVKRLARAGYAAEFNIRAMEEAMEEHGKVRDALITLKIRTRPTEFEYAVVRQHKKLYHAVIKAGLSIVQRFDDDYTALRGVIKKRCARACSDEPCRRACDDVDQIGSGSTLRDARNIARDAFGTLMDAKRTLMIASERIENFIRKTRPAGASNAQEDRLISMAQETERVIEQFFAIVSYIKKEFHAASGIAPEVLSEGIKNLERLAVMAREQQQRAIPSPLREHAWYVQTRGYLDKVLTTVQSLISRVIEDCMVAQKQLEKEQQSASPDTLSLQDIPDRTKKIMSFVMQKNILDVHDCNGRCAEGARMLDRVMQPLINDVHRCAVCDKMGAPRRPESVYAEKAALTLENAYFVMVIAMYDINTIIDHENLGLDERLQRLQTAVIPLKDAVVGVRALLAQIKTRCIAQLPLREGGACAVLSAIDPLCKQLLFMQEKVLASHALLCESLRTAVSIHSLPWPMGGQQIKQKKAGAALPQKQAKRISLQKPSKKKNNPIALIKLPHEAKK